MESRELNPTTVRLTLKAQKVKDELAPIFGLKNILSAGLVAFSKLSDTEQKVLIREANGLDSDSIADNNSRPATRGRAKKGRKNGPEA